VQSNPQPAPSQGESNPHSAPGSPPVVEKVNREAQSFGERLNANIVGQRQQNENDWKAAHPIEAARQEGGPLAPPPAPPQGRALMQPEGRTSMQPGEVAPQQPEQGSGFWRVARDVTQSVDHPGTYNPFALELNPLGLFVGGRLSFTAEYAPVTHNSITFSPYFVHTSSEVATSGSSTASQAFTGVGGELGYRYYTGHRGPNGIFIGPSLIAGVYNAGLPSGNQAFTNIGIAADVGVQDVFWNHLIVGGGIGIEYLQVSHDFGDLPTGPSTIASSGLKPRLLLSAGYGF
jgi:hypothetical protein